MSAGKRVYRNLSEAAETCMVTLKIAGGSYFLVKRFYILKMHGSRSSFDLKAMPGVIFGYLELIFFFSSFSVHTQRSFP